MRNILAISIFTITTLTACTKEGPEGPAGPQGPQGSANVGRYEFSLPFSGYTHWTSTNAWGKAAPVQVPQLQNNQLAIVYISVAPAISGYSEWVQQPFSYFFGSGNTFVECFHSIDGGRLYLYARNSAGTQPFTNASELSYKVFILQSSMMQLANDNNVDVRSLSEFEKFIDQYGYQVKGGVVNH